MAVNAERGERVYKKTVEQNGIFCGEEEQGSERSFRRQPGTKTSGLCDDVMGRPRVYTSARLVKAVNRYFKSITRQVPLTEMVPTGEKDEMGHMIYEPKKVIHNLGEEVTVTEYLVPPSEAGLCEALKIHRSTWTNYCDHDKYPEFAEITETVKDRMKGWNEREMLTRPGKDLKGILFNLEQNYGYGGEKHEVSFGAGALEAFLRETGEEE